MAAVEQQILVKIKNLVEGLPQVQALASAVKDLSKSGGQGVRGLSSDLKGLGAVSKDTNKVTGDLFAGFKSLSNEIQKGGLNNYLADLSKAAKQTKALVDPSKLLGDGRSRTAGLLKAGNAIQLPTSSLGVPPVVEQMKQIETEGQRLTGLTPRFKKSLTELNDAVNGVGGRKKVTVSPSQADRFGAVEDANMLSKLVPAIRNSAGAGFLNSPGISTARGAAKFSADLEKLEQQSTKTGAALSRLPGAAGQAADGFLTMILGAGRANVILGSVAGAAGALSAVLVVLAGTLAAAGLATIAKEGVEYNSQLESAKVSLASLITTTSDIRDENGKLVTGMDAFNAATDIADGQMGKIQSAALATRYEFQDILQAVTLATAAVGGTNVTLDQTVGIVSDLARAAGALKLSPEAFQTQVRQILTGATRVQTQLAQALFPGQDSTAINKQIKGFREAGTLVTELTKRLEVFRLTANTVENTFSSLSSNIADAFKLFAGQATVGLFDKLKSTMKEIVAQVIVFDQNGVHLTPTFQKVADILNDVYNLLGSLILEAVKAVFAKIGEWADYIYTNKKQFEDMLISVVSIAESIGGILIDLISIVGDLGAANNNTSNWATGMQGVALFFGFIRDLINVIIGSLQVVVGLVGEGLGAALRVTLGLLNGVADTLLRIIGLYDEAGARQRDAQTTGLIKQFEDASGNFATNGAVRAGNGLNGEGTLGALDRLNQQFQASRTPRGSSRFSARPRPVHNEDDAANKRAAKERLHAAQQLFDALEKYQIANAKREADLFKLSNEQILKGYQRRYDQGLISAEEFYSKKKELELDDLDHEQKSLEKAQEFARDALSRDLGAIQGTFNLTEDQLSALEDKLSNLDADQLQGADPKVIKQATEYTKYLEQTAQITQELKQIELKRADIAAGTTESIQDQSRAYRQQISDIQGELASTIGEDGTAEINNLKKRIADELPKLLTESNKGVPGIEKAANAIRDIGSIDITGVREQFAKFNIDIDSLSTDTQTLLRLFEALGTAVKLNAIQSAAGKIRNKADFDAEGVSNAFNTGGVNLDAALSANTAIQAQAVTDLTAKYNALKVILDQVEASGGIVDPAQVQAADALGRAIEAIKNDFGALALIQAQADRDSTIFSARIDAIEAKRQAGSVSSKAAREQVKQVQLEQIAALEIELQRLEALDQKLPDVAAKVAAVRGEIDTLHNDVNKEFIATAQTINGTIGDAFSTFLTNIQDGTQSIADSFRQLVSSLLLGIAKAIAQALLLKYILQPLGLTGDDSGGIGGFLSGLIGGGKADGGFISGPGTSVSDSVLTPTSHGEAVIPVNSVRKYGRGMISSIISGSFLPRVSRFGYAIGGFSGERPGAGGAGSGGGVRIINTLDPNLVHDFMASAAGEEIILNVIGKNPGLLQRLA